MSDEVTPKPKRKTKAQRAAEAAPPTPDEAQSVEGTPEGEEVLDGVFIVKRTDPTTGELLPPQVIKNGNLGLLEVESLIQFGLKEFRDKMGFS